MKERRQQLANQDLSSINEEDSIEIVRDKSQAETGIVKIMPESEESKAGDDPFAEPGPKRNTQAFEPINNPFDDKFDLMS